MRAARRTAALLLLAAPLGLFACSSSTGPASPTHDAAPLEDAGKHDSGKRVPDASKPDAHHADAADRDAGRDAPLDAGPPTLVALAVTGTGVGSLVPAFSPNTHDYYVRCKAGANALTVAMTASPGADSSLLLPVPASASAHEQTVQASANPGDLLEVAATAGAASADYWVRCLPPDFPQVQLTAYPDAGTPGSGYYVLGTQNPPIAPESAYAMILDGNGVPVWYSPSATNGIVDVDPYAPGKISYVQSPLISLPSGYAVEDLTATPSTITMEAPSSTTSYPVDYHELKHLPNGDDVVLSYNVIGGVDLTGLTIASAFDGGAMVLGRNSYIEDCTIVEFDPTKTTDNVVWTWSASDHFDAAKVCTYPQEAVSGEPQQSGATTYDVFHCDSLDVDPANGNFLLSARHMSSVFYVERSSSKVLWKMGGVNSSKDGAAFVSAADPFSGQHDGRLIAGWSQTCNGGTGQVSVLDDESSTGMPARGVIYNVVVGAADGGSCSGVGSFDGGAPKAGTAVVAWQYARPDHSASGGTGSLRVNPDGTRTIGWGLAPPPVMTEVDVNGNKLRTLTLGEDDSYRVLKVPLATYDLDTIRANAGK